MTMSTAGRAVVFSGTAVAIGLALMLFMPLPFMRGFGLAGLLIPLVSVAAAITLLPVLMYWLEDRMDRVRLIPKRVIERREDSERNFWARLADRIMKRPYAFAAGTTAALLLLAAPVLTLQLGPGSNEGIPQNLAGGPGARTSCPRRSAKERWLLLTSSSTRAGPAERADSEVQPRRPPPVASLAARRFRGRRCDRGTGRRPWTRDGSATCTCRRSASTSTGFPTRRSSSIACAARWSRAAAFPADAEVLAGGGPPFGVDFLDITYGAFPWLVLAVLAADLRVARARLPLSALAAEGDRAEPALDRGRLWHPRHRRSSWAAASRSASRSSTRSRAGSRSSCSRCCSASRWTTRCSSSRGCARSGTQRSDNEAAVATGMAKTGRLVTAAGPDHGGRVHGVRRRLDRRAPAVRARAWRWRS